jgi:RHS repeat-associated protein
MGSPVPVPSCRPIRSCWILAGIAVACLSLGAVASARTSPLSPHRHGSPNRSGRGRQNRSTPSPGLFRDFGRGPLTALPGAHARTKPASAASTAQGHARFALGARPRAGKQPADAFPSLAARDRAQATRAKAIRARLRATRSRRLTASSSAGLPYAPGDVFVGDWNGTPMVRHDSNTGQVLEYLNPTYGVSGANPSGMCNDAQGDLYVTMFEDGAVVKFDNAGHQLQRWTAGAVNADPESCSVDNQGHVWVGFATDAPNNGQASGLVEYDSNGNVLATYRPQADSRGIDWILLGGDNCTLYYTSEASIIRRFNICTGQPMSTFANLPNQACYQMAIRPNGEMMVACSYFVYRLSPVGTIIQSYSASSLNVDTTYFNLFSLALNTDNKTFFVQQIPWFGIQFPPLWAGPIKVDIASGQRITQFAGWNASSVSVFGTAGPPARRGGPLTPSETLGGGNPSEPCLPCQAAQQGAYPVNTATGDFWHTYTDDRVPGRGFGLELTRTYNSLAAGTDGPFGYGWASSYTMSLTTDATTGDVTIHQENGATTTFSPGTGGSFTAPPNVFATLVQNGDGTYTFTRRGRKVFAFSSAGKLTSERDLNGNVTTLSYDGSGNLATVTEPAGRQLIFGYGANGKVATVTDPGNRTVSYGYDGAGNLTTVTDTGNGLTRFGYAGHLLTTVTDPNNGAVTNVYDGSGRVTSQSDQLLRKTTYVYESGKTTITSQKGNVTVQLYDSNGELTQETRGSGTASAATWTYGYDPQTLMLSLVTDPDGHTRTYARDAHGNPTRVTDGLGRSTVTSYNQLDEPTQVTDPSGVTTSRTYDAAGNPLTVSRPLTSTGETQTTTNHYDDPSHPGDVTSVTDGRGKTTSYAYDAQGNLKQIVDPLGNKTTMTYNALGQMISKVSPRGNASGADPTQFTTTYDYTGLGQLKTTTDPLGHTTSYGHDGDGNLTSVTDAGINKTIYTYDLANELTKVTRPDTTTLTYDYDDDGNRKTQTNGGNHATSYVYDPLERLSSVTDPLNRTTTLVYDGAGNETSVTDAANQKTTYTYDAANQVTAIAYTGRTPDVSFTYTANGQRKTMSDGTGTTTYGYDSLDRLTSVQNGAGQTVGYGYDLANNMTSITYPNGKQVSRSFDDANELKSVGDWLTHTTQFSYDPDGNLTQEGYPNGTSAASTFDRADRLSGITDSKGASTLASFSYTRDNNGLLGSTTATGLGPPSESYTYNSLNQLSKVDTTSYAYDGADAPTTLAGATLGYDAASEATSVTQGGTTTNMSYDARGNRLNGLTGAGAAISYVYDQANRLTRVQTGTGAASTQGLIAAGASHSLAVKSDGTVWTWGLNSSGQLGNGNTTTQKSPVKVTGIANGSAVAGGGSHSLALRSDGTVSAWGANASGQLGNGTTTNSSTPVAVSSLSNAIAVAAGASHSLALKTDGTIAAWGLNSSGQLGNGVTTNASTPVAVSNLTRMTAIAAGSSHSLALRLDGTVWAWGANVSGQLGNGTNTGSTTPVQVTGLSNVIAIAAGGDNSYALTRSGAVWAWGDDQYSQLGNTSVTKSSNKPVQVSISGISAIAAGAGHALAIAVDGTVWAWGRNSSGQLGDGGSCGRTCTNPVHLTSPAGVIAVAGGSLHSLAATSAGAQWAWGDNGSGQLGNGTTTNSKTPIQVTSLSGIKPGAQPSSTYNGDGLRMSKSSAGTTLSFAWDASSPTLLLTDGSTSYVYGPEGRPVEQVDASGNVLYFHQDQLGSTRLLTDSAGAVAGTYTYDAYGTTTAHTGTASTALQYEGEYIDSEIGLYYLRARYYHPATGQFLTRDPLEAVTQQPYAYAHDDPLNAIDPSGLGCGWTSPWDCPGAAAHAVDRAQKTVLHVGLNVVATVPYGVYYVSYQGARGVNHVGDRLGAPGHYVSRGVSGVLFVPGEATGLAGDAAIDWYKGHTVNHESICDEGAPGYINPLHAWLPSWLKGPQIYLPGIHPNGDVDFEW